MRVRAASYQNFHHGLADGSQLVLQSSTLLKAWTHACHPPAGCGPLLHKHTHIDVMEMQGWTRRNTYAHTEEEKKEKEKDSAYFKCIEFEHLCIIQEICFVRNAIVSIITCRFCMHTVRYRTFIQTYIQKESRESRTGTRSQVTLYTIQICSTSNEPS